MSPSKKRFKRDKFINEAEGPFGKCPLHGKFLKKDPGLESRLGNTYDELSFTINTWLQKYKTKHIPKSRDILENSRYESKQDEYMRL